MHTHTLTHTHTHTHTHTLQRCVEAVAASAFKASNFPVVITLENHTDVPNQKAMANDLRQVLGDKLFVPTEEDRMGDWKSPEALKGKVRPCVRVCVCVCVRAHKRVCQGGVFGVF